MDKRDNAFEKFINNLLNTHDGSDRLRNIVLNSDKLYDSVDKLLLESHLEAFFIPATEVTDFMYTETMLRLGKLRNTISNNLIIRDRNTDYEMVELIKSRFSERNCVLSKEILLYLNDLYKKYKK